jgi:hypothetical protein
MLDVHPPHHAATTWRDFFIHIVTIVIGLLIAIGLEQTVEYFHHRHEIREAREALAAEHEENVRRFHRNVYDHLLRLANQHNDQRVMRYLLAHPGTPQEKLPGVINYGAITLSEPVESAWSTVEHSDVASLMPPAELRALAIEYKQLDRESEAYHQLLKPFLTDCADYLTHTVDITTTDRDEQRQTLQCFVTAQARETVFGDQLSSIADLKGYELPISWWQMIPFFHMSELHHFADSHPETNAPTLHDQQQVLSILRGTLNDTKYVEEQDLRSSNKQ